MYIPNRIIIIEYKLPCGIIRYGKCLSYNLLLYATQTIKPFSEFNDLSQS